MKEIEVKMWELTKEELEKLAKRYPAYRILVYDRFFSENKVIRADTVLRTGYEEDDYLFLCFDDPSRYIQ